MSTFRPLTHVFTYPCLWRFFKVSGVGYDLDGEITTEETYLNQGRLAERDVVVDHSNHPGIRRIVEVHVEPWGWAICQSLRKLQSISVTHSSHVVSGRLSVQRCDYQRRRFDGTANWGSSTGCGDESKRLVSSFPDIQGGSKKWNRPVTCRDALYIESNGFCSSYITRKRSYLAFKLYPFYVIMARNLQIIVYGKLPVEKHFLSPHGNGMDIFISGTV